MNVQIKNNRKTVRNVIIFTTIVLTIGWIGRGLDVKLGNPATEGLGILLWISIPLLASLLLRAFAGDGWRDFGIKPNFKGNAVWYVLAFLVYPFTTVLILIVGRSSGLIAFPNASMNSFGLVFSAFALALIPNLLKNFFEEGAWRGYLAPKVYSLGLNDYIGHLIVGFVWGAWHIPYYLFFLDHTILGKFTTLNLAAYVPLAIVVATSWAFVYGELRLLTNSIWPAVLMHAVEDSFLFALILDGHIRIAPGTDWLISPMNGLISVVLFLVIGVGLHEFRKRKNQHQKDTVMPTPILGEV